jgi:hypothetical protein
MEINILPTESQAQLGATHELVITHADLTAAATTQTLIVSIPNGSWVKGGFHILDTEFVSPSSTSLAYEVGDDSDPNLFMTSTEVDAAHASTVTYKEPTPGAGSVGQGKAYTGQDTIDILFTGSWLAPAIRTTSGPRESRKWLPQPGLTKHKYVRLYRGNERSSGSSIQRVTR